MGIGESKFSRLRSNMKNNARLVSIAEHNILCGKLDKKQLLEKIKQNLTKDNKNGK